MHRHTHIYTQTIQYILCSRVEYTCACSSREGEFSVIAGAAKATIVGRLSWDFLAIRFIVSIPLSLLLASSSTTPCSFYLECLPLFSSLALTLARIHCGAVRANIITTPKTNNNIMLANIDKHWPCMYMMMYIMRFIYIHEPRRSKKKNKRRHVYLCAILYIYMLL